MTADAFIALMSQNLDKMLIDQLIQTPSASLPGSLMNSNLPDSLTLEKMRLIERLLSKALSGLTTVPFAYPTERTVVIEFILLFNFFI